MFQGASDLYLGIVLNDPPYRCRGDIRLRLVSGYSQISVPKAWGSAPTWADSEHPYLGFSPTPYPGVCATASSGVGGKSRTTDERPHWKGDRATSASCQGRVVWPRDWQSAHVAVCGRVAWQPRSVLMASTRSQIILQEGTVAGPEE